MYEQWYGFSEKPFNLTPDPKYLYLSRRHAEAFAHLEFGRREHGGFMLLTGEVGTGKTTLARYFLSRLPERTATAVVLYPALSAAELLRAILDDFHVAPKGDSRKDLVDALHRFLLECHAEKREVVVLIDEAQDLAPDVLEQVRLLSNLETDTDKLIQIVLMGQSELRDLLARRELRQLAQRITARYHLDPLQEAETAEYVRHRVTVAGGLDKVRFEPAALRAVQRESGGIPRLVNLICDRALLAGYVAGSRVIEAGMVRKAAAEVKGEPLRKLRAGRVAWLGTGAIAAALLLAGLAVPRTAQAPPEPAPSPLGAAPPTAASSGTALPGAASAPNASAPPAAPAPASALEDAVRRADRTASFRTALGRVSALWPDRDLAQTPLRTHLDQLRRLDLPAVLEMFHPARPDTCFLALLGLDGERARVSVGDGPVSVVALAEVDRLWTRQAVFLWKAPLPPEAEPERAATWAGPLLSRLGYPAGSDLRGAVGQFQRETDLVPDGIVGTRTLLALYSRAPEPRPRLVAERAR